MGKNASRTSRFATLFSDPDKIPYHSGFGRNPSMCPRATNDDCIQFRFSREFDNAAPPPPPPPPPRSGNEFSSEALPGSLPVGRNNPRVILIPSIMSCCPSLRFLSLCTQSQDGAPSPAVLLLRPRLWVSTCSLCALHSHPCRYAHLTFTRSRYPAQPLQRRGGTFEPYISSLWTLDSTINNHTDEH